jgi:hypothetical protein
LVVVALLVTSLFVRTRGGSDTGAQTDRSMTEILLAAHPPVAGGTVTLPNLVKAWTTQVWFSTDGEFCRTTFAVPGVDADNGSCDASRAAPPPTGTVTLVPEFTVEPGAAAAAGSVLVTVQGRASQLKMTMFGVTTTMPLEAVPTNDGSVVEVGQGLLPLQGHHAWGDDDITSLVALDGSGQQVAEWRRQPTKSPVS